MQGSGLRFLGHQFDRTQIPGQGTKSDHQPCIPSSNFLLGALLSSKALVAFDCKGLWWIDICRRHSSAECFEKFNRRVSNVNILASSGLHPDQEGVKQGCNQDFPSLIITLHYLYVPAAKTQSMELDYAKLRLNGQPFVTVDLNGTPIGPPLRLDGKSAKSGSAGNTLDGRRGMGGRGYSPSPPRSRGRDHQSRSRSRSPSESPVQKRGHREWQDKDSPRKKRKTGKGSQPPPGASNAAAYNMASQVGDPFLTHGPLYLC